MAKENTTVRPFGMRDKIGYAMGDFGNDFTFILASSFMLKFYTDVMGVSAALVGTLMMLARFVDAFTDTMMGQIVDRSQPTKEGRFIPWIRRFMGPVALASFLLYASWFRDMPMAFKIFWMFFTYLLWGSVCYTGVNIPYGSMASAITADPDERTQLSSWRNIGATLAGMVISVVLPMVVYYTDAEGHTQLSGTKMSIAALVCSIGAVICYLLCVTLSTERVKIPTKTEKFSFVALLKQLGSSRALITIIIAAILLLLTQLTMQGMNTYIYPNYFNNAAGASIAGLVASLVALVLAFILPNFTKKFGKKEIAAVGTFLSAIIFFIAYFMHTDNMYTYIAIYMLGYVGLCCFNVLCWAMIIDVIDDDEVRQGKRSDGAIYSVYSFARKLGQAFSSGLTGALLTAIGYTAETAFDPAVTDGIYNIATLIPAIGYVALGLVLLFAYPLSKKKVDENSHILAERREGKK